MLSSARFSWRKVRPTRMSELPSWTLRYGGKAVAVLAQLTDGRGWYWYSLIGPMVNTAHDPQGSRAAVQDESLRWARENRAALSPGGGK